MLSICTTIKNRSRVEVDDRELMLFPNCVSSLIESVGDIECELVVADWESNDWPLQQWLPEAASPIPVKILTLEGVFSRGRGLNEAAKAAGGDVLAFIDVDALICEEVIREGMRHVYEGRAYFPILYSFNEPNHETGRWREGGYGHCVVARAAFEQAGGWPMYNSWGREDKQFIARLSELQPIARHRVAGFYHQWHPDDIDFKNQYGEESDAVNDARCHEEELKRGCAAIAELEAVLPADARFILVDEERFERSDPWADRAVPFLEKDGMYWGHPTDDQQAIQELERLYLEGVKYVVFPWITFWWFECYPEFNSRLRARSRCVLRNEQLEVFELQETSKSSREQSAA